jgi:FkbM family methyltransferase
MHWFNRILTSSLRIRLLKSRHPSMPYVRHYPGGILDYVLVRCFGSLDSVRFLQIGANNGRQDDPLVRMLERYRWTGIMMEPMPAHFASLQNLYRTNPRIRLINAALDITPGRRPIYDIDQPRSGLPEWSLGLASFSRDQVTAAAKVLGLGPETVTCIEVDTLGWGDIWPLMEGACDLLVMDTEGYDLTLLASLDLALMRPRVIQFEHGCATPEQQLSAYGRLRSYGYELATENADTVAWIPNAA